ncbi:hypothetical protein [Corynebacterium halotolerans]|uniref:hypothetical protein n=1 Tax=Corynebacterium halotolerans TaxID=225326 RepID=UPI003CEA7E78
MSEQSQPRRRRRVVRPSPAENIDRTADLPDDRFRGAGEWDGERIVDLEPEGTHDEDSLSREEFWRGERPPHHG